MAKARNARRGKHPEIIYLLGKLLIMLLLAAIVMAVVENSNAEYDLQPHPIRGTLHEQLRQMYPEGMPWGTVTAHKVNFREGPGTEHDVICQLSYGCAVEVMGARNGWYQVIHWNHNAPMWVKGEYITLAEVK